MISEKLPFAISIAFFSFLAKSNILIVQMRLIRRIVFYLCLNMINFDAVDFSESRSEEVISFF